MSTGGIPAQWRAPVPGSQPRARGSARRAAGRRADRPADGAHACAPL